MRARTPQIKKLGGYCEIRNPARRANERKTANRIWGRTIKA
jgi:hypothetical protein